MPIAITTASVVTTARILSPLISDLYKSAKENTAKVLKRWQEASFPKRLAKRINNLAVVKTLWSPEDDVSILNFYYPPKFIQQERRNLKTIESVKDLGEGNIVIQGIVGQGKSVFLRFLAVKEATLPHANRLPIFLELRNLQPSLTLIPAIYKTLSTYDIEIDDNTFDHLAKSGRFVLLLDAFDELDESLILTTLSDISYLAQKYPELQILVTSRPGNEIQKVPGFRIMRIRPLRRHDYAPFLKKLGLPTTKVVEIEDAIKLSPSRIADLITTPLMLTLVVIVYESEKEIPPTLPEFFERLFQIVFTRHDRLKAGFNRKRHTGLSERRLQCLFEAFCFMTLQNSFGRSLTSEQFSIVFSQAIEYGDNCKCDEDKFRLDMVKVACLMLEEGIDTTTFLHKSVLEYYAAAFIKHSTDEVANLFYQAAKVNQRAWREVIRFLADIDPYRYSKEFSLEQLDKIQVEFIAQLSDRNDSALLKTISAIHPDFSISYHLYEERYEIMGIGPLSSINVNLSIMYEPFDSLLISAIEDILPGSITKSELENILQREIDDTDSLHEIDVSIYQAVNYGGTEKIWQALDIFSNQLDRMKIEALEIINQQEKRKLIFGQNTSPASRKNK